MIFTGIHSARKMITWGINTACNFNCTYCPQRHNNLKRQDLINTDILSESLEFLNGEWLIYITGGEPFLEKNIIDICQVITRRHYLLLNTNLSTSNIFDFADKVDPERTLNISASVHIGEREKRDFKLNSFIKKILYLQNKGFNIIASYVLHPVLFDRVKQDITFLKSSGVQKIRVKIFRGIYKEKYYPYAFNADQIEFLKNMEADYPEFEILSKTQDYYRKLCTAGQDFFVMNRTGNLKRCTGVHREYGNLFEMTMVRDVESRPCPLKKCVCPYEGIRNAMTTEGSMNSIILESLNQKYLKSTRIIRRIIEDPKPLGTIKDKVFEVLSSSINSSEKLVTLLNG